MVQSNFQNARPPSRWALENTRVQKALGITPHQYDSYRTSVGQIESGNDHNKGAGGAGGHYWGPYQFGTAATAETNKFLGERVSKQQFKGNPDLAERHFDAYSYLNHQSLMRNSVRYRDMSPTEKLGVLGYAHNQGAGGAANWLRTGRAGSDAFGTSGKKYFHAILDGLKKVGEFIWNGIKAVGEFISNGIKAIGGAFSPQPQPQGQQHPHPSSPQHLQPQPPHPQYPNPDVTGWRYTPQPDQRYTPFPPPTPQPFVPERGTVPNNGWVNNRPLSEQSQIRPLQTNVVMGDSIGVGMKSQYPGVKNVAVSGWSISAAISQFRHVPQGSVADVYLGSNNGLCTPEENKRQTLAFLKAADAHGVRINNWILPGEYRGHQRADTQLKAAADVIRQTIQEYNMTHKPEQRITAVETRSKGITLAGDGLHLTPTGNQQLKTQIAQQNSTAQRTMHAGAQPHPQPIPLNGWRLRAEQPQKSA